MNYIKAFTTYIKGIINARKNIDNFKVISFTKELGQWYVDYPEWKGKKGNLAMVAGADTMLDALCKKHNLSNHIVLKVCDYDYPQSYSNMFTELVRTDKGILGAFYKATETVEGFNDENKDKELYLCPVTLSVLGYYPKYIYFAVVNKH